ncbi:MAG TPA: TPM domain-containing protein [Thermoanaerobaculia bacterium]|nr:TPM domain-containing protein [Thermoanaerobaculia bacterium]HQR66831.1 TPM domain-containing protein [Thermoanaerobaculia bacterium]
MLRRVHKEFLARVDAAAVEAAIRQAERATTGEIRVAILPRVSGGLEKAVRHAAERLGMTRTKDRNGVLILVDPSRRSFLVWGDTAIHARVEERFWKDVAAAIEERFRAGDFTGGLVRGVEIAGRELASCFPAPPGERENQLPDGVDAS